MKRLSIAWMILGVVIGYILYLNVEDFSETLDLITLIVVLAVLPFAIAKGKAQKNKTTKKTDSTES